MIFGELFDGVAAHHVDARVADMGEPSLSSSKHESRGGRSHSAEVGICLRFRVDASVGALERIMQRGPDIFRFAAEVLCLYGFGGDPGCGCAPAMTAHSVRDDEQASAGGADGF